MMLQKYNKPIIKNIKYLTSNNNILASSVIDKTQTVTSTGQEVINIDFSNEEFNHNWE